MVDYTGSTATVGAEAVGLMQSQIASGSSAVVPSSSGDLGIIADYSGSTTALGAESVGDTVLTAIGSGSSAAVPTSSGTASAVRDFSGGSGASPESGGTGSSTSVLSGASAVAPSSNGSMVAGTYGAGTSTVLPTSSGGALVTSTELNGSSVVGPSSNGSMLVTPDAAGSSAVAPSSNGQVIVGSELAGVSVLVPTSSGVVQSGALAGSSAVVPTSSGTMGLTPGQGEGTSTVIIVSSGTATRDVGFYTDVSRILRTRYRTEFADPFSVPTQYDNLPFERPEDVAWARVMISFGEAPDPGTVSTIVYGQFVSGALDVRLWAPSNYGMAPLWELADSLVLPFTEQALANGVHLTQPVVASQGFDGSQWRVRVRCPFWAENIIRR